jgi:hypothetical protein
MSPRLALTVGAVQAFAFGLPLLIFPALILALSGLTLPDEGSPSHGGPARRSSDSA